MTTPGANSLCPFCGRPVRARATGRPSGWENCHRRKCRQAAYRKQWAKDSANRRERIRLGDPAVRETYRRQEVTRARLRRLGLPGLPSGMLVLADVPAADRDEIAWHRLLDAQRLLLRGGRNEALREARKLQAELGEGKRLFAGRVRRLCHGVIRDSGLPGHYSPATFAYMTTEAYAVLRDCQEQRDWGAFGLGLTSLGNIARVHHRSQLAHQSLRLARDIFERLASHQRTPAVLRYLHEAILLEARVITAEDREPQQATRLIGEACTLAQDVGSPIVLAYSAREAAGNLIEWHKLGGQSLLLDRAERWVAEVKQWEASSPGSELRNARAEIELALEMQHWRRAEDIVNERFVPACEEFPGAYHADVLTGWRRNHRLDIRMPRAAGPRFAMSTLVSLEEPPRE